MEATQQELEDIQKLGLGFVSPNTSFENASSSAANAATLPPLHPVDLDDDSEVQIIEPRKPHPYQDVLSSKSNPKQLGNKEEKRNRLARIAKCADSKKYLLNALPSQKKEIESLLSRMQPVHTKGIKLEELGVLLCDTHEMIEKATEKATLSTTIEPLSSIMKWFTDVVPGCAQAYSSLKTRKKKNNDGKQTYGQEIQRGFDMEEIIEDFENYSTKFPCAVCNHCFVINHGESKQEIETFNKNQREKWEKDVADWRKNKQHGKKPKKPSAKSEKNLCLCGVMHSNGRLDGGNCLNCKNAMKVTGADSNPLLDYSNGKMKNTCEVCNCTCLAAYSRDEYADIARNTQAEKEKTEGLPQENKQLAGLKGLQDLLRGEVQHQTHELLSNGLSNEDTILDDALAMTSISLSQSQLNNDVGLRNELQKEVGPLATYVGTNHIQELRRKKRQKKNSLSNTGAYTTPVGSNIHNGNRAYRNNLSFEGSDQSSIENQYTEMLDQLCLKCFSNSQTFEVDDNSMLSIVLHDTGHPKHNMITNMIRSMVRIGKSVDEVKECLIRILKQRA